MAFIEKPLLTIAIPTYNRSKFLDKALYYIDVQVNGFDFPIEIIVSDNCSDDDTSLIVQKYIDNGLAIRYIKNEINKGADFNIAQCYTQAKGKYVVAFGDDDIFNKGSIVQILNVLNKYEDIGVFYLNWKLLDSVDEMDNLSNSEILLFKDYIDFFEKISHNVTFISGNVVNSKFIKNINFDSYLGTNLVQLPLFLTAAFESTYNIVHKAPLVSVEPENSGGFSVLKVFGKNINDIFRKVCLNSKQAQLSEMINCRLFMECFPGWIYRIKTQNHSFTDRLSSFKLEYNTKKELFVYLFFVYPVIIMPEKLLKIIWPIFKIYSAILRKIILFKKKKNVEFITINK
ncbi:glycosyltransferase [Flavobacterium sp. LC2016-01]|uniref:glycosyltransferase family 2 protein n=1 Tax=Flavobacterium sp. LC2016-01 TaxID=2675876 RepID=UPI0012BAEF57|nr:glycosyltransferase [Flavobacterium sp. LC2016-01]MTH17508.1 glycosyltransferase [Flavobacterium sp. LC2016-01]